MSAYGWDDDDSGAPVWEQLSDRSVRSRTDRQCSECRFPIRARELHSYVVGTFDGEFHTVRSHIGCPDEPEPPSIEDDLSRCQDCAKHPPAGQVLDGGTCPSCIEFRAQAWAQVEAGAQR